MPLGWFAPGHNDRVPQGTAFMILIGSALSRGLNVSCGCFGKISPFCPEKIGACNIVQNSIMLAAAVLILLCSRHALAVDRAVSRKCCC